MGKMGDEEEKRGEKEGHEKKGMKRREDEHRKVSRGFGEGEGDE